MHQNARGRNLLSRLRRGRFSSLDLARAVNLSYVLHERSTSPVVRAAVQAAHKHSQCVFKTSQLVIDTMSARPYRSDLHTSDAWVESRSFHFGQDDKGGSVHRGPGLTREVDCWLAPSVGHSDGVLAGLEFAGFPETTIHTIDRGDDPTREVPFFRSIAALTLPDDTPRTVGVATLVVRPGGRSGQLVLRGPFAWPDEMHAALRALESIIQAHAQQWAPLRQLWPVPLEDALPDEVS